MESLQVRNILSIYYQANALDRQTGLDWYQRANNIASTLAYKYGFSIFQAAGVIAAISPRISWERNVILAEQLLNGFSNDLPIELYSKGVMGDGCGKAHRIMRGDNPLEVLGGHKVRAFYNCILNYSTTEDVCIDTHAISITLNTRVQEKEAGKVFKSQDRYNKLVLDFQYAAELVNIKPHQMQAITWVTWRRIHLNKVDNV